MASAGALPVKPRRRWGRLAAALAVTAAAAWLARALLTNDTFDYGAVT